MPTRVLRRAMPLLLLVPPLAACGLDVGTDGVETFVQGAAAVDACERFAAAVCASGESCLTDFDAQACVDEDATLDCANVDRIEGDIEGCIEDFASAECSAAWDGNATQKPGRCEGVEIS